MKVMVHARYMVTESFEIEVDSEEDISDKAWNVAYDFVSKYNTNDVYDVAWEVDEDEI